MTTEMIVGISGSILAAASGIITAILMNKKTVALLEWRMQQVERRLDAHNDYGKKFVENSEQLGEVRQDIAVIKTTLEFIREGGKK